MRLPVAILVFVAASVTAAVALAFPLGGLSPALAWTAFAIGAAAAVAAWRGTPSQKSPAPTAWDILLLCVFALASLRAFLWLIYPVGDEWRVLSPNNLGDLSKHIHFIRYLANGVEFWPESPFFPSVPLSYYLGTDLFNALLLCVGIPLEKGLVWVGLCGAALSAWALWRWGGAFAIAALLFNGGLAGLLIFRGGQLGDFQSELGWKNFFLSMFVTQRALLFAIPASFLLLSSWRGSFFRSEMKIPRWVAYLLYATMPIFSIHAFAFLSLVLAAIFVVLPVARRPLFLFVAAAFPVASALVYFVTGGFSQEAAAHWHPGWMQAGPDWIEWLNKTLQPAPPLPPPFPELLFWVINFGVSLPLLGILAWQTARKRSLELLSFAAPSLLLFAASCFFRFAPWEWDNTKFFIWAWLCCAPYLWSTISCWPLAVRLATCTALFFSGTLSLMGGLDGRHGYRLVNRSELAQAEAILSQVPFEDRIATEPTFDNPAVLLGRPVVCGYEGMLWAHGLDYRSTFECLNDVLAGRDLGMKKARLINAKWILRDKDELIKVE